MSRIILHAGMHKTGTSSIQAILNSNRSSLKNNDWEYVFLPKDAKAAYGYIHGSPDSYTYTEAKKELEEIVSGSDCKNFIFSSEDMTAALQSEDLWMSKGERVSQLFESLGNIEVLIYYRKQDSFYESAFQQRAKEGVPLNFKETLKRLPIMSSMDWYSKFKIFESCFSDSKFTYISYEKAHSGIGITGSFLKYATLNDIIPIGHSKSNNASSKILTRIFAEYGPILDPHDQSLLSDVLCKYERTGDFRRYKLLSLEDRLSIFENYYQSNKNLYSICANADVVDLDIWRADLLSEYSNNCENNIDIKDIIRDLLKLISVSHK
ncbi:hypothetical protein BTJ40_04325 [Microbulbifer sp. A4B17]|uniref:hypothetical protein n=1 Tax=Microbulbifer sp. A4B17 TaxID=359370 RepID=UPI000D52B211|nr:hypothetical protein [Microbulbifer sp. A4B17]AWF80104.1 hypothetical protein BTJ40_04325 [Microbulbifer sp. A4B17]